MISCSKILHQEKTRIKVNFPYNNELTFLLRQIEDAKWSRTHKAWHIPYNTVAFEKLKSLFPDLNIDAKPPKSPDIETPKTIIEDSGTKIPDLKIVERSYSNQHLPQTTSILIEVIGRKISLKMPKNDIDVKFILTFRFSKWEKENRAWLIPNYPGNLDIIKEYFKERISNIVIHHAVEVSTGTTPQKIESNDFLCVKTHSGRLRLIFGFNKVITYAIKKCLFGLGTLKTNGGQFLFRINYLPKSKPLPPKKD